ncbi:MAG: acyl-CoA synthetase [Pseudomonadota bacterium]|uniref:acyl-CoA synthetase n=1 Tax=Fodinicurvata fenggangensis TaxID=1121830 RepID=UPI00054DB0AA|nr:long-chain fatty acid--CoA ligase [Fodinicurvata fenggangensis]
MFQVFDFAAKRASLSPDKTAMHEVATGRSVTYRELNDRAERFAAALRRRGIEPAERVAILCHNCIAFFEILFGCGKAGVILTPLNWRQTASELTPVVEDCTPRILLHDAATAELAGKLATGRDLSLVPLEETQGTESYEDLIAAEETPSWPPRVEERDPDAAWYMLYTSGTTGTPKAVIQTFGMALANYINIAQPTHLTGADTTPCYLPLFHTAGINLHTLPTLICGGSVKVLPGFDADRLLDLIGGGELTALLAVPAVYQALSLHERFAEVDLTRVRSWSAGGAPLPDHVLQTYAVRGAYIQQGCGMTETGPTTFLMDAENVTHKPGSVGKPQLLVEARIVDHEGRDVADGEAGELLLRGPNITPGYWNRPEITEKTIVDGWLHTGDVARRDDEGYFYLVDRIKDMYISGGENVYPAEVEAMMLTHPQLLEVAVVGVPDERWGEIGHAYLRPRPGEEIDLDSIAAYCREHLAGYRIPKRFFVVEDFPRTPAGKVQKHVLRARSHSEEEPSARAGGAQ